MARSSLKVEVFWLPLPPLTTFKTGKGELTTYWLCGKDDYDRPLPEWDAEDGPSHGLKIDDYLNVR